MRKGIFEEGMLQGKDHILQKQCFKDPLLCMFLKRIQRKWFSKDA